MNILRANQGKVKHIYRAPFGYDATDDGYLIPVEDDLEALQLVNDMVKENALSIREGAVWLSDKCSRTISHEGLRKRLRTPVRLEDDERYNGDV